MTQSAHTSCIEHSGMKIRDNINIFLNLLGVLLLGYLINQNSTINSKLDVNSSRLTAVERHVSDLDKRVRDIESGG